MTPDLNCLSYWFPPIHEAGLPVPETDIVRAGWDLTCLLDGVKPLKFDRFIWDLHQAAHRVTRHGRRPGDSPYPVFLRTGHGSGKHYWRETCWVEGEDELAAHVYALVEWSHMVDFMGLPHEVWAVREPIPNIAWFRMQAYQGMPWVPEYRLFVLRTEEETRVEHVQPYWPLAAVEEGVPDIPGWRELILAADAKLGGAEGAAELLGPMAIKAVEAVGTTEPPANHWSVDFLWSAIGERRWWLTDMALADDGFRKSYRYDP